MPRLLVRAIVLALLLGAGPPTGTAAGEETAVPEKPPVPLAVTVDHGLVSVDVRDALLADVLHEIAAQAGVQVTIRSGGTDRVTQTFAGVSLDEAIRRLAQGYDVVLIYGSARGRARPGRLAEVRVYEASTRAVPVVVDPRQRNARLRVVRSLIWQARRRRPGALTSLAGILASDPDPVVRRSAAAALAGLREPEAVAALTTALGDQDASVRVAALSSLGVLRDGAQAPAMIQLLSRDPDAAVRRAAVRALARLGSEEARRGLEAAARDPDASVRQAAVFALNQLARRARAQAN
jgi:hypothetical protein